MNIENNVFSEGKVYYEDAYYTECDAVVVSCEEGKDGYQVVLSQTVFFPEGGGQPSDVGELVLEDGTRVEVLKVLEKQQIYHITKKPLEIGQTLKAKINWEHRFDMMQQHSGEHIFSGMMHKTFGVENIGFHVGKGIVTIDFDKVCDREAVLDVEKRANQYVWENHPCVVFYPTKEDLQELSYRSKIEIQGQVRLVEFSGADLCACCGTHVKNSAEVGLIKVLSVQNWRGGTRIEMASGRWAFEALHQMQQQNSQISVKLSAKPYETAQAVERISEELAAMKFRCTQLELIRFEKIAQSHEDAGNVCLFEEGLSSDSLRKLCDLVMNRCGGRCLVFSGNDQEGYKYACGEVDGDLRDMAKSLNEACQGRGGGKPFFVQGSVQATKKTIEDWYAGL